MIFLKNDYQIESISTDRLQLKILTADILQNIFLNEAEQNIRLALGIANNHEFAKYKAKCIVGGNNFLSFRFFMIYEKQTEKLIGNCSFHRWVPEHSRAEIGYYLNDEFRQKGLMKEAVKAILTHGFQVMKLNRVEAFIGNENIASLQLVKHFGFKQEGIMREHYFTNNKLDDSICFSLLQSEYQY